MTNINLIPQEEMARRDLRRRFRKWMMRLGSTIVLAIAVYASLVHLAAAKHGELTALSGEYTDLQDKMQRVDVLLTKRDQLEEQRAAIEGIRGNQSMAWLLDLVGSTLPPKCYLSLLEVLSTDMGVANAQRGRANDHIHRTLRMRGWAPNHRQVGQIIRGMTDTGSLQDVVLSSINEINQDGQGREVEFEITCTLRQSTGSLTRQAALGVLGP